MECAHCLKANDTGQRNATQHITTQHNTTQQEVQKWIGPNGELSPEQIKVLVSCTK